MDRHVRRRRLQRHHRAGRAYAQLGQRAEQRLLYGQGPGSPADITLDPITYDKNGNILAEQRQNGTGEVTWDYTHDAWNRLVKIAVGSNTKATYGYNALNWRIAKGVDTNADGTVDWKSVMYYSANWQLLEERIDSNADATDDSRRQYLWGARYIDDIIHCRLDADIDGDFTDGSDKRYYHLTDVQFSTVALTSDAVIKPTVLERVTYQSYGKARHHRYADLTEDGATSGLDLAILNGAWGGAPKPHIADLDRDGDVDGIDLANLNGDWGGAQAEGVLSLNGNIIGWDGYLFNAESEQYQVRHRIFDVGQGRWISRDQLAYVDSMSLYEYVLSDPVNGIDPSGLRTVRPAAPPYRPNPRLPSRTNPLRGTPGRTSPPEWIPEWHPWYGKWRPGPWEPPSIAPAPGTPEHKNYRRPSVPIPQPANSPGLSPGNWPKKIPERGPNSDDPRCQALNTEKDKRCDNYGCSEIQLPSVPSKEFCEALEKRMERGNECFEIRKARWHLGCHPRDLNHFAEMLGVYRAMAECGTKIRECWWRHRKMHGPCDPSVLPPYPPNIPS